MLLVEFRERADPVGAQELVLVEHLREYPAQPLRVDQGHELIGDLQPVHMVGRDLRDLVLRGSAAGGFEVKHAEAHFLDRNGGNGLGTGCTAHRQTLDISMYPQGDGPAHAGPLLDYTLPDRIPC